MDRLLNHAIFGYVAVALSLLLVSLALPCWFTPAEIAEAFPPFRTTFTAIIATVAYFTISILIYKSNNQEFDLFE